MPGDMIWLNLETGYQESPLTDMGKGNPDAPTHRRPVDPPNGPGNRRSSRPIDRSPARFQGRRDRALLPALQLVEEPIERQLELGGRFVDTGGDLLSDLLDLLVADFREPADPVEHLPQRGNLDLVARRSCLDGLTGFDAESGQPR